MEKVGIGYQRGGVILEGVDLREGGVLFFTKGGGVYNSLGRCQRERVKNGKTSEKPLL